MKYFTPILKYVLGYALHPGPPVHLEFSVLPATAVQEGEPVTLRCSAKSSSPAQAFLTRKTPGEEVVLESQDGVFHFQSVTPADAGDYECRVKNEFGDAQVTRALHVECTFP